MTRHHITIRPRHRRIRTGSRPSIADMLRAFSSIDGMLARLEAGHIHQTEAAQAVFFDRRTQEWNALAPELRAWLLLWERLAKHYGTPIDLTPIAQLTDLLDGDALIPDDLIAQCQQTITACKRAYRRMDMDEVTSIVRTIQIAVNAENAGLCGYDRKAQ